MGKYTDDEIRSMPKITAKIAADYLGISPMMVTLGMRNNVLPIGFAIKKEDRYSESWSYNIVPERLIAYNHGRINEVQVQNIEKSLNTIIEQFEEMKHDLVFLPKDYIFSGKVTVTAKPPFAPWSKDTVPLCA